MLLKLFAEQRILPSDLQNLLLQLVAPQFTQRIRKPVSLAANVLFLLLVLLLVVVLIMAPNLRTALRLGMPGLTAIVIMVLVGLGAGHYLGGPAPAQRASLATASIARNLGLALFIAQLGDYGQASIPTLLAYMILGALVAMPYGIWNKSTQKA